MKLFFGADNLWSATFTNEATGAAIASGTLTMTLFDDLAAAQLGSPLTGSHVADGLWRVLIPDTHTGLLVGMRVRLQVVMDGGANLLVRKLYYAQVVEDQAW